ncbi:DUF3825 domain-containing protein [Neglecta sp. X4]|uniref:DUF3825 domain-containing protein n=1 Tax=unclassified Neglectibacter TaxID=2632164 RepID=UPI0013715773|nr:MULTISPECIES: DUF3825 domain-containing protein [unclassified Neglectibacter]NBI16946.1 DUF3825 domain-containing protein [Neglectibacter sp. 59]NBJ72358.1 DUF3825 domain-containing protein [Neglectibacter sp. X4]NCE80133.1 DUF3825 domain-containing protein [Neglectibacter sp. X58]
MKRDVFDLPESLYEFAQIADFYGVIEDLANLVEDEDWNYHNTLGTTTDFPILENYIRNTYIRLAREKKVAYSSDFGFCCFDTGLLSKVQHEPIYMQFCENTNPNIDCYWYFSKFFRRGDNEVRRYPKLPEMAFYWEDPTKLIFDPRKELIVNVEHIIQDNKARFPNPFSTMPDYQLQLIIDGSVKAARERLRRNYKIAVPQYFITSGTIQLLIPLCLAAQDTADLAIIVEDYGTMYRASTCLTLDQAMNNARLLARPDRDWLNP